MGTDPGRGFVLYGPHLSYSPPAPRKTGSRHRWWPRRKCRTLTVSIFPSGEALGRLLGALLIKKHEARWVSRQ